MDAKFKVGDRVKTIKGSVIEGAGEIVQILIATSDLQLLWGSDEPHYLFKDVQTSEYISVIEGGIEKV